MAYLRAEFFGRDTLTVARDLIGTTLVVGDCEGRIVETEAYAGDAASHWVTRRNQAGAVFHTYGHVYVYFTYGMHHCLNFTADKTGPGAVLIRAVDPLKGLKQMARRRGMDEPRQLAGGPGRLCQAFAIDLRFNGEPLGKSVKVRSRRDEPHIATSTRIGISNATELEWRFYEEGNLFVSRLAKRTGSER